MMREILIGAAVVVAVLAVVAAAAWAGNRGKVLNEKEIKAITDAMPDKAPAKPRKPRKVLVYSKCGGFYHGSIPYGNKAFEIMGKKTGAFEAVVSDDLSNFEADKLKEFDAIILNNNTGEMLKAAAPRKPRKPDARRIKDPAKLQQAQDRYKEQLAKWEQQVKKLKSQPDQTGKYQKNLLEWLKSGKGIVGTHGATDTRGWEEFAEVLGGRFAGHPWHMKVPLKNDDPTNPINAVFAGMGFDVTDEIYQFKKGFYSREKQRVLLSLDMSKLKKKGGRQDNDYAISWIKTCGKGRVFFCSLGHRNEILWNPVVLKHYLAGIQWAIGDLEGVETKPNPLPTK